MGGCNYCCVPRINCKGIALVAALAFGVGIGVLAYFVFSIPLIGGFISLGIGVVSLGVLLYAALSDNGNQRNCLCRHLAQILVGIIGTVIFAVLTVSLFILGNIILSAVLIGLTAFFAALIIGTFICYIICIANCSRYMDNNG